MENTKPSRIGMIEKEQKKNLKLCIALPHTGLFAWNVVASFLNFSIPKGVQVKYHFIGSCLIYDAREKAVEFAKKENCDYILFIDSDMVTPKYTIQHMLEILQKTEYQMVTGLIFKRIPPYQPCFYNKVRYDTKKLQPVLESPIEFPDKGVLPIQGMGLACSMIDVKIFNKIKKPYFFPLPNMGEDLTFCLKANQKGIKIGVALGINVGHVSNLPITKEHYRACYDEYMKKNNNDSKGIFE